MPANMSKAKKTHTLKSQTSRPRVDNQVPNYIYKNNNIKVNAIYNNDNASKFENPPKHQTNAENNRAKSALRYRPNSYDQNGNRSFHNLDFHQNEIYGQEILQNELGNFENEIISEDFVKNYKYLN